VADTNQARAAIQGVVKREGGEALPHRLLARGKGTNAGLYARRQAGARSCTGRYTKGQSFSSLRNRLASFFKLPVKKPGLTLAFLNTKDISSSTSSRHRE
jgi:hypothetical protein